MPYRIVLLSFLFLKVNCHTGTNTSDVIVINTGHAEAGEGKLMDEKPLPSKSMKQQPIEATTEQLVVESDKEDVIFVPNEKEIVRNNDDDYFHDNSVKMKDVLTNRQSINDATASKNMHVETESPSQDVMFISGKNNENVEDKRDKERRKDTRRNGIEREVDRGLEQLKKSKLDCTNLDCNNTLNSICGGKQEHRQWKYRLFLNECYFRKVNCGFRYEFNRYKPVPKENCINVAGHYSSPSKPYYFKPMKEPAIKPDMIETVRNSSARRSLHVGLDGIRCTHPCPLQCTNDYEPECAVTPSGERRVFINHCKLDYNSCFNGILWRRRPMSECVGGQRADIHQNRAFINWMQRVGIVDNKGKLVLA